MSSNAIGTQMAAPLVATLLYVPADREHRVAKALDSEADVVIIDLEDSVAAQAKCDARASLGRMLHGWESRSVQVRVNNLSTPWGRSDLAAVAELDPQVEVRLPKVESRDDVDAAAEVLGQPDRPIHCLIESALGVERAFDIGSHDGPVVSLALGEEDLRSELGLSDEAGLTWARGRLVMAARAAGLPPPAQSVYTAVHDHEGLAASCRAGRAMGFVGRCAIHPAQLPVIRAAYRPTPDEVERSRSLLRQIDSAHSAGRGVTVMDDGSFVDQAMVSAANRLLALEEITRPRSDRRPPNQEMAVAHMQDPDQRAVADLPLAGPAQPKRWRSPTTARGG